MVEGQNCVQQKLKETDQQSSRLPVPRVFVKYFSVPDKESHLLMPRHRKALVLENRTGMNVRYHKVPRINVIVAQHHAIGIHGDLESILNEVSSLEIDIQTVIM
eukprot:973951-Amphidinium_carterae.1